MTARYPGTCQYCSRGIVVGDEIRKGNGGRHAWYSHASCVPSAGVLKRAGYLVIVTGDNMRRDMPVGTKKQYVHKSMAEAVAISWRNLGATVEVRAL